MFRICLFLFFLVLFLQPAMGQDDCNKLGAWLWYIEITDLANHTRLADSLHRIGVGRIYVKVADGKPNTTTWPELADTSLVKTYKNRGIEVWAWSYNYPGNEAQQAVALRMAAATGYQGYVVDVESEFDNKATQLTALFAAFRAQRDTVRMQKPDFALYCSTWGNPMDHNFAVGSIDTHVDAFMPQTYVEEWGQTYMDNAAYWVRYGTDEYRSLGTTKPIHHTISVVRGKIKAAQVDEFIEASGPETSVYVVPGQNTTPGLWASTWTRINWKRDFCPTGVSNPFGYSRLRLTPNPASDIISFSPSVEVKSIQIFGSDASPVAVGTGDQADISALVPGFYIARVMTMTGRVLFLRFVKL